MHKFLKKTIKATIISLIVALLILVFFCLFIRYFFRAEIENTVTLVSMVSIKKSDEIVQETVINDKKIKNYPQYGSKYATIEIDRINRNLPVYFGDTLEILKKGVGHSSESYFPGEGGSIIYMGHNSKDVFRNLGQVQKDDEIIVTTTYGKYTYKVYDMAIVKETEYEKLPIQKEKEVLMLYTCYPFANIGHAYQRYVLYAELVQE